MDVAAPLDADQSGIRDKIDDSMSIQLTKGDRDKAGFKTHAAMLTAMEKDQRVRIGVVGLSGYGNVVRHLLEGEDAEADGRTRFAAVFAPDPEKHQETITRLRDGGTIICDNYEELLATDVDAVWLPVPIDLHRPMTEQALAAGKAVLLEKPVAGCIDDHDAIAQAADAAGLPVAIGFQDVYRPSTLPLKRRLLAGDFGTPKSAVVWGLWPRDDAYYGRSTWAGRFESQRHLGPRLASGERDGPLREPRLLRPGP